MIPRKNQFRLDSPPLVVDYIVLPIEGGDYLYTVPLKLENSLMEKHTLGTISDDFKLIKQNRYYLLYERANISEKDKDHRKYFFDLLGLPNK